MNTDNCILFLLWNVWFHIALSPLTVIKRDGEYVSMFSVCHFSSFEVDSQFPVFPLGGRARRVRIGVLPGRLGCGLICMLIGADGWGGLGGRWGHWGRSSRSTARGLTSIGWAAWHLLCLLVLGSAWNSLLGHLKTQWQVIAEVVYEGKRGQWQISVSMILFVFMLVSY